MELEGSKKGQFEKNLKKDWQNMPTVPAFMIQLNLRQKSTSFNVNLMTIYSNFTCVTGNTVACTVSTGQKKILK